MSKEKLEFPESGTASPEGAEDHKTARRKTSRRSLPVYLAAGATLFWAVLVAALALTSGLFVLDGALTFSDLALFAAGLTSPVVVFWLIALVYQRTDPLLEHRLDLARGMDRTLAPIDNAERRLKAIQQNIQKQLQLVEAASDVAVQRIENLENRFQEQVDHLFSATTDVEAKAASIKDLLERERTALENFMDGLHGRLESVEAGFRSLTGLLASVVDETRDEAAMAGRLLEGHAVTAREAAAETARTLAEVGELLERQKTEIAQSASDSRDRMEDSLRGIMVRLKAIDRSITGLDEKAGVVAHTLEERAEGFDALAERAGARASQSEQAFKAQMDELAASAEGAVVKTREAGETFEAQAQALESQAQSTLERTREILAEANEALDQQSAHMNEAALSAGARAIAEIKGALSAVENLGQELEDRSRETSAATLANLMSLKDGLRAATASLTTSSAEQKEHLTEMAVSLADHASMITLAANDAAAGLRSAGEAMDERGAGLGQRLEETKAHLEGMETRLESERQKLADATSEGAARLEEMASGFEKNTRNLQTAVEETTETLATGSETLTGEIENIQSRGKETAEDLTVASALLEGANKNLEGAVKLTLDVFESATGKFAEERGSFVQATDEAIRKLEEGSASLKGHSTGLAELSEAALAKIAAAGSQFVEVSGQIAESAEKATGQTEQAGAEMAARLHAAIETAGHKIGETIDDLGERTGQNLSGIRQNFDETVEDLMNNLAAASLEAENKAKRAADSLSSTADKMIGRAELFIQKVHGFESKLDEAVRDDFLRTSTLLLESLAEASLDIDRLMKTDIPDKVWRQYLEGDRSVFARRTLKIGTRSARKIIKERFDSSPEFRDAVLKFHTDFESLMTRAMSDTPANALSISLISSDMGKLYILLAQAIKKLG